MSLLIYVQFCILNLLLFFLGCSMTLFVVSILLMLMLLSISKLFFILGLILVFRLFAFRSLSLVVYQLHQGPSI